MRLNTAVLRGMIGQQGDASGGGPAARHGHHLIAFGEARRLDPLRALKPTCFCRRGRRGSMPPRPVCPRAAPSWCGRTVSWVPGCARPGISDGRGPWHGDRTPALRACHHGAYRKLFRHRIGMLAIARTCRKSTTPSHWIHNEGLSGIPAPKISYTLSKNSRRMLDHGVARSCAPRVAATIPQGFRGGTR